MTYYPYLRGRMYDMLALEALVKADMLGPHIVPIIEPVRDSKELQRTVQALIAAQQPFSLIANPQVSLYGLHSAKRYPLPTLSNVPFFHPAAILANDFSADFLTTGPQQTSLLVAPNYPLLAAYQQTAALRQVAGILISNEARLHAIAGDRAIQLTDSLTTPEHVADYQQLPDEFFSGALWAQAPFGYQGFGDYSLMGQRYFDRGMPERAIALHVIYATADGTLRIHHFVSDSNASMRGQRQKFFEALTKLTAWAPTHLTGLNATPALQELLALQTPPRFPGLGVVKKLALMHHFQLMHRLLSLT
ncbi:sce7725 family protein [Lactiplantibacillus modestisalitolerans]|uniref:Sce7725 family protein n=1 Tax=Lactiplantibacillus modestisalitolerans TaxID=1457219 RepID=A0ABV5WU27_9LACO|nr:sce7725 family protein [Lactiplantibacillus modestisalitolerans]